MTLSSLFRLYAVLALLSFASTSFAVAAGTEGPTSPVTGSNAQSGTGAPDNQAASGSTVMLGNGEQSHAGDPASPSNGTCAGVGTAPGNSTTAGSSHC